MTAIGTPTFIPVVELLFWLVSCGDVELLGAMVKLWDAELVGAIAEFWDVELLSAMAELWDDELVGAMVELCNVVCASELVGLKEEELDVSVAVDTAELVAAPDCSNISTVENGYGVSEVVRLVVQQFQPPGPCPGAPPQHQLLPLGSQRDTWVQPWN